MIAHGAGAAAAVNQAHLASGSVVRVEPDAFLSILDRADDPLVVYAVGWVMLASIGRHQYLTTYRGLTFVTRSTEELLLPKGADVIHAKSIHLPVMC